MSPSAVTRAHDPSPRIPQIKLGVLQPVTKEAFIYAEEDLEDGRIDSFDASFIEWPEHRNLLSSHLSDSAIDSWLIPEAFFKDSILTNLRLASIDAHQSTWWNLEFTQCRIGAGEFYGSSWRGLHFKGCKIDYLNLRHAKLQDIQFSDCVIGELDLLETTAKRCAFPGTQINKIDPLRAKLQDFDLSEATLGSVHHIDGLKGTLVTWEQIVDLGPVFAQHLGIKIS